MKIKDKVAVVTGAASGIGLAIAHALTEKKVKAIALVDSSDAVNDVTHHLKDASGNNAVQAFCGDVSDGHFRQSVFSALMEAFGPVQICVPAAGILHDGLAVKQDRETAEITLYDEKKFDHILKINLQHPTYWAMETIAGIARTRSQGACGKWQSDEDIQAVNILIGSVSSRGNRGQVSYAAAKAGLIAVCKTLNLEGLVYGVQSKIIHPGLVDTAMVESIDRNVFEKQLKPLIGLGRKIKPNEIADIVCAMIENPVMSGEVWADASITPFA